MPRLRTEVQPNCRFSTQNGCLDRARNRAFNVSNSSVSGFSRPSGRFFVVERRSAMCRLTLRPSFSRRLPTPV